MSAKIIDLDLLFLCDEFFQEDAIAMKNKEADFFAGYLDAEEFFSTKGECQLRHQNVAVKDKQ